MCVDADTLQQLQEQAQQPEKIKQIHVSGVSACLAEQGVGGHPPVHGLPRMSCHTRLHGEAHAGPHLASRVQPIGEVFKAR